MATIWNFPTRVIFGAGELRSVAAEASRLGLERVLLVTDPGLLSTGMPQRTASLLEAAGIGTVTFADVDSNPTEANVVAGSEAFKRHGATGLVGFGGGSSLDTAKLIAVRSAVEYPFEQLDDAKGGDRLIPDTLPPVLALPTTAGTGSEVGRAGVLTVESTGRKTVVFAPAMLPRVAILDPELSQSMPPHMTAATGMDALTHCLEALVAKGDHPMADGIALMGIELVARSLPKATQSGNDLLARGNMLKAALMGAVAFQKGLGACHSLAHPLSSECGLHHGLANALCLPAVIEYNLDEARVQLARVATLLGAKAATELPSALKQLSSSLGLPSGLAAVGVSSEKLEQLSHLAFEDACHISNPRACKQTDLLRLYQQSM